MNRALVNGAGGFIGGHLVKRLKAEGFRVRAVDLKRHEFSDRMIADIADKRVRVVHIPGPLGVRGRDSDNRLNREWLKWAPSGSLREGLEKTYAWIESQMLTAREIVCV